MQASKKDKINARSSSTNKLQWLSSRVMIYVIIHSRKCRHLSWFILVTRLMCWVSWSFTAVVITLMLRLLDLLSARLVFIFFPRGWVSQNLLFIFLFCVWLSSALVDELREKYQDSLGTKLANFFNFCLDFCVVASWSVCLLLALDQSPRHLKEIRSHLPCPFQWVAER